MNNLNNTFEIEKMNAIPGIYMIYNTKCKRIYVGQTKDLKDRMKKHIINLYVNARDNENLQNEFNQGGNDYIYRILEKVGRVPDQSLERMLNECESLYYQAAQKLFHCENVHNIQNLTKVYKPNEEALERAIGVIREKLKPLDCPTIKISSEEDVRRKINKDILDKYNCDIISDAGEKLEKLKKQNPKNTNGADTDGIQLDEISIKSLYEAGKLKHLLIGKMGDYVGDGRVQCFTDILSEKLAYIAHKGKCLWATAGPNVTKTHKFIQQYGFEEEKRMYAIFALTSSKYEDTKEEVIYYWEDMDGNRLENTAPAVSTNKKKALIIEKFWTIKEDFDLSRFLKEFYRHDKAAVLVQSNEYILNTDVESLTRLPLCCITAKKEICDNVQIQEELNFSEKMVQELRESIPTEEMEFRETNGETFYILAQVVDYVCVRSDI